MESRREFKRIRAIVNYGSVHWGAKRLEMYVYKEQIKFLQYFAILMQDKYYCPVRLVFSCTFHVKRICFDIISIYRENETVLPAE